MHLHSPVQNTTGCRIPQRWYVRGAISLTNRHMLSIVSCTSLGIPASGYLNTWKVGTLWTRSIEVAQLPKICSANHSHTWSLIPVASSPKSAVLLKTGRRWQPVTHFVIALCTIWKGAGWKRPSSLPSAALDVLGWDRTACPGTLPRFKASSSSWWERGTVIGTPLSRRPAQ